HGVWACGGPRLSGGNTDDLQSLCRKNGLSPAHGDHLRECQQAHEGHADVVQSQPAEQCKLEQTLAERNGHQPA
ncbi:unnamed protein product, partial [Symbiodinium pilosum]